MKHRFTLEKEARILLAASLISSLAFGLLAPIYAIFVENIGGDILDVGLTYALFSIVTGVFIVVFGTTRYFANNVRKLIIVGYGLLTLGSIGYLLVSSPRDLFFVQIIWGISIGMLEPAWDSVFSSGLSETAAARHWSVWAGTVSIVIGVAAILGSVIVHVYSFQTLFILMAVLNLFATIVATKIELKSPVS